VFLRRHVKRLFAVVLLAAGVAVFVPPVACAGTPSVQSAGQSAGRSNAAKSRKQYLKQQKKEAKKERKAQEKAEKKLRKSHPAAR
jgi:hypothetical protein